MLLYQGVNLKFFAALHSVCHFAILKADILKGWVYCCYQTSRVENVYGSTSHGHSAQPLELDRTSSLITHIFDDPVINGQ